MRDLSKQEIQIKMDNHKPVHRFEIDKLFDITDKNPLSEMQYRYLEKGIRFQSIWDIETSEFHPEENFIICYDMIIRDILTGEEQHLYDEISRADIHKAVECHNFDFDKRLLQTLSWNLRQTDHTVGHFLSKFDFPYFRSRCLLSGQPDLIPDYGTIRVGDTWRMMKTSMKSRRNTLQNFIRQTNGYDEKTHVDLKYWYITHFKDHRHWRKAMDYIKDHCIKDVRMTADGLYKAERFNPIGVSKV